MRDINTIGIMFEGLDRGDRESFPTLRELSDSRANYVNYYSLGDLLDDDKFGPWLVIAHDPRVLMYSDDDWAAMDSTNYEAILAELSAVPINLFQMQGARGSSTYGYDYPQDAINEALELGIAIVEHVLILAPRAADSDGSEMDDIWNMSQLRARLADYPLLDEDAYSVLEWAAWEEYAPQAFADEIRDYVNSADLDDATRDAFDDIDAFACLGTISQHLHYESGFSGEYSPAFLEIVEALARGSYSYDTSRDAAELSTELPALVWAHFGGAAHVHVFNDAGECTRCGQLTLAC